MAKADVSIRALEAAGGPARHEAALERIFFEASSVQAFANDALRQTFKDRWLGRYLDADNARHAFIALDPRGEAIGYVIGTLADAASGARFADVAYFRAFAHATPAYPAHLHINVDRDWRSQNVGARLIDAFADHARAAGVPGIHIVTGAGMRNVGFYLANGFHEVARADVEAKSLVMLGRPL